MNIPGTYTFTYQQLLEALEKYETEAIQQYPHRKKLIQMTILAMQDFMQSEAMRQYHSGHQEKYNQTALPGFLQVPQSLANGKLALDGHTDEPEAVKTALIATEREFEAKFYRMGQCNRSISIYAHTLPEAEEAANQQCDSLIGEWVTVIQHPDPHENTSQTNLLDLITLDQS